MKVTVKKNLGNAQLEVECEGKDEKEALSKATFFTKPDYCGLCKSNNIVWDSNKAKTEKGTFTYIKRKCLVCGAESTAGEYQDGGLFWKNWEHYQKKATQPAQNTPQEATEATESDFIPEDDIPVMEEQPDPNMS